MKYTITSERALQIIDSILAPFEIINKIDYSWEGKWWHLSSDAPQRQIIVWDKNGEAVFTYDIPYKQLAISRNHVEKIISYIPLSSEQTIRLLIKLFIEIFDNKFKIEHLQNFDLSRHDRESFEDDEDEN